VNEKSSQLYNLAVQWGKIMNPFNLNGNPGISFQATPIAENHDVQIISVENGFMVRIGCKTFVETDFKKVCDGLALYFKDRPAAMKKYLKQAK
jgi:capsule polysaccharide export protein KpsC/LpsZ